ncbi:putative nuclease HARBI1 isoform X1 [Ixodes scapularis]
MTVELQVLCALRFYGTGSFQGMVASDEHVARDQKTVSVAVRAVSVAIVRRLGVQRGWIHFPETPSERFDAEKGFRLLGRIPGVIGCVDGTMVSIVGPSKNDPTVTKAAYWCRKYFYALNVMVWYYTPRENPSDDFFKLSVHSGCDWIPCARWQGSWGGRPERPHGSNEHSSSSDIKYHRA